MELHLTFLQQGRVPCAFCSVKYFTVHAMCSSLLKAAFVKCTNCLVHISLIKIWRAKSTAVANVYNSSEVNVAMGISALRPRELNAF